MKATRRTAIGAAIAALFAPTVRLRNTIDIERLLAGFLDKDSMKVVYDHTKPYHLGGWTYATDSRHMAWAELSKPDEDGGTRRIPDIEVARRNLFKPTKWMDLKLPEISQLLIHEDGLCPKCGNRRVPYGPFYPPPEWFKAGGDWRFDYDPDDNTIRDQSCDFCEGGRRKNLPSVAMVGEMPFSYWRLLPIAAIPGVRVSVTEKLEHGRWDKPDRVLCFEAGGIQGMAVGLYPGVVKAR